MNEEIRKFFDILKTAQSVLISGHTNPDADAISSCLALQRILSKMGKEATILLEPCPDRLSFLDDEGLIVHELPQKFEKTAADLHIALDCGDLSRLGGFSDAFSQAKQSVNIDHHISNSFFGDCNIVDFGSSSTSELIFKIFDKQNAFDQKIARYLYAGILSDTGGFRHSATQASFQAMAKLLDFEIDITEIYNKLFLDMGFSELKINAQALQNAKRIANKKIIFSSITLSELASFDSHQSELGAVVSKLLAVQNVDISAFFYELAENEVKASFRANCDFDLSKFCQKYGGGGHKKASGCSVFLPIEKAVELVLEDLVDDYQSFMQGGKV